MTDDQHVILSMTNDIVCAALTDRTANVIGNQHDVLRLIDNVYNKITTLVTPRTISSDVEEV